MPKLSNMTLDEVNKTTHGFQYTSVGFEKLGAMEYTIVQMIADQSECNSSGWRDSVMGRRS
jgi:hypothetical protein